MLKIYHNPRCKKSREGLAYLKSKTNEFEIRNYLSSGINPDDIREILLKSNLKPFQLVRSREDYFKTYLKGKNFSDDEWVQIIVQNPKILQRPIVVGNYRAVLANPPQNIDKIFK
ncbi:MAG: ArsC/Spx/MgsR family protein [Bacteroidales bacterium]